MTTPGVQYGYIMACHNQHTDAQHVIPSDAHNSPGWVPFHTIMGLNINQAGVVQHLIFLVRGLDGLTLNPHGLVRFIAAYQYITFQFHFFQMRLTVSNFWSGHIHHCFHAPLILARANGPPQHHPTLAQIRREIIMRAYVYPGFTNAQYTQALSTYPINLIQNPNQGQQHALLQANQLGINPVHDLFNAWNAAANGRTRGMPNVRNLNRNGFI